MTIKSARNVPNVKIVLAAMVTTYDVVWADKIVIASEAVGKMEEVFSS
jgi:ribosomal protein L4